MNSNDLKIKVAEDTLDSIEKLIKEELGYDILSNVPIIKTIINFMRASFCYRDYTLIERIVNFIKGTGDIYDRRTFAARIKKPEEEKILFKALIKILDNIEDERKIKLIINLFQAFMTDKLSIDEYLRFSHIVSTCFYDDLCWLINMKESVSIHDSINLSGLIGTCLVEPSESDYKNVGIYIDSDRYIKSRYGDKFCKCAFEFHDPLDI